MLLLCDPVMTLNLLLQSKKKGLSLEEKRTRMMEIFFDSVSFPVAGDPASMSS